MVELLVEGVARVAPAGTQVRVVTLVVKAMTMIMIWDGLLIARMIQRTLEGVTHVGPRVSSWLG